VANIVAAGLDQWLWRTGAAGTRHFLPDALNSTRALSDDAKAISTRYQYEPFGETATTGPGSSNPSQFTGRENDGTGLYYYRARYYHPGYKRFISEDPIGLAGDVNFYQYVHGNPISNTDPEGMFVPLAVAYAKCALQCMAIDLATSVITGGCFDAGASAGDCLLECVNPMNWLGGSRLNIAGKVGTTYRVPGSHTNSGKDYVGRHNGPDPAKNRRSDDGRDRRQADVTGTYNGWDPRGAGASAEQSKIDAAGGIQNLDNKINAVGRR
jgi:RHS repeat-associated protein